MLRTKTKLDDLLERHKDIDLVYVNNTLKEYDDHVQYYSNYTPNNRWKIPMSNRMNGGNWQKHKLEKK